jgi:hypothetical protein
MAFKSLVLDIDGVLVRDKTLLDHVKHNCVHYVKTKVPAIKDAAQTNKSLYLAYGHTARGLNQLFKVDTSDFNEKVYDKKLIEHLCEVIYGTEFQRDAKILHDFSERSDWIVTLFTNAPPIWATYVKRAISDNLFLNCPEALKPDPRAYKFPDHHVKLYVDDSLKNLGPVRQMPNWIPIHYTEDAKERNLWCSQVNSIEDLSMYINSFDMWEEHNHQRKFDF